MCELTKLVRAVSTVRGARTYPVGGEVAASAVETRRAVQRVHMLTRHERRQTSLALRRTAMHGQQQRRDPEVGASAG